MSTSHWLCRDYIDSLNIYTYSRIPSINFDYLGLKNKESIEKNVTLVLTRKVTLPGLGTYGSLEIQVSDGGLSCCQIPDPMLTIELISKDYPNYGVTKTYNHKAGRFYTGLLIKSQGTLSIKENAKTSIAYFYANRKNILKENPSTEEINQQGLDDMYSKYKKAEQHITQMPEGKKVIEALLTSSISLNTGEIMIHSGLDASFSGGCIIVGKRYKAFEIIRSKDDVFSAPDEWKDYYKRAFNLTYKDKLQGAPSVQSGTIGFSSKESDSFRAHWQLLRFLYCAQKNNYKLKWIRKGPLQPDTSNIEWIRKNMN